MRSIRTYLLSRLLGGATFVLVAAGTSVYLVVARSLEAQHDDRGRAWLRRRLWTKVEL